MNVLDWLEFVGGLIVHFFVDYVKRHPVETAIVVLTIVRLFGTTVQTGWKGVLFRFGRVRQELEPGFHWLIPIVHKVRKVPVRSVTLHLAKQRITTADGLVYEVQANLVYHLADPKAALVEVADVRQGIEAVVPLIVKDLLEGKTRAELVERKGFDEELAARADARLRRWGVAVEQAGFVSIAPTAKTLRLTQLRQRTAERERAVLSYLAAGLSPTVAAALLGADRRPIARSAAHYKTRGRDVVLFRRVFLNEERERAAREHLHQGKGLVQREAALAQADAAPGWRARALARARMASRGSLARPRPHTLTPPAEAAAAAPDSTATDATG
ncbi:MAG TPA: SPFH domain-containing protein [Gemmataceae bacterium]|nr:SPFH domain-containing protein [Gemmataceae bacterium]